MNLTVTTVKGKERREKRIIVEKWSVSFETQFE